MTLIDLSENIYVNHIQYSQSSDFTNPNDIIWPFELNNSSGSNKTVFMISNLELTTVNMYFIMRGPDITIDGQNNTVTVNNNVQGYPGLVQNGTSLISGKNNIIIQNLGVKAVNSTLADYAGWIGQIYMNNNATGCQVKNCYSTGAISKNGSGGIFGRDSSGTATNCYSTGIISGDDGYYENGAGGIFGTYSSGTAINCYSSGDITGRYAGGIFGDYGNNNKATNCYSTGNIIGQDAGGICGWVGTAKNCYSSGAIGGAESGGIFGSNSSGTATNCYSSGTIVGTGAGGIFGARSRGTNTNNISRNTNGWSDTIAITILTDSPTYNNGTLTSQGTTWIDYDLSTTNTPWLLKSFNSHLYNPDTLTTTRLTGRTSSAITTTGVNYQIIDVNNTTVNNSNFTGISSSLGAITFENLFPGTYTVRVLRKNAGTALPIGYQINTFTIVIPFNFTISPLSIDEGINYIGILTSNSINTPLYSIVSQPFTNLYINGNKIYSINPFNYNLIKTYTITIQAISANEAITKSFTINIKDVPQPPVNTTLTDNKIAEDSPIGSLIGLLQTTDPDPYDFFTYNFEDGEGSNDNTGFTISNDKLISATTFNYRSKQTYSIRVRSADSNGFSVVNILQIYVIIPIADGSNISALVNTVKQIVLIATPVSDKPLDFILLSDPKYGSLTRVSNGIYNYLPLENKVDSFQYIVKEGTMTSFPGTVFINNYSQTDIDNIPRTMGTFTFDNISFDGDIWTFGTMRSEIFIEFPEFFQFGNWQFYKS